MMEHSIKDERPDLDAVWPLVPDREIAKFLLSRIVDDPKMAQNVWNAVVRPLYDLREVSARWPHGRCSCGAVHPARYGQHPGLRSDASRGHRMRCRYYVGPLEHRVVGGRIAFSGTYLEECLCGKNYPEWADDDATIKSPCPDMLFVWRGPRPEEKGVTPMTEPILEPPPQREDDKEPEPSDEAE